MASGDLASPPRSTAGSLLPSDAVSWIMPVPVMKRSSSLLLGASLLFVGVIWLLGELGYQFRLPGGTVLFLFGALALGFIGLALSRADRWWAFIPAGVFAGLTASRALATYGSATERAASGSAFLGCLAAGFAAVALPARDRWWAFLPAFALAGLSLESASLESLPAGTGLFGCLSLGFLAVHLRGRQAWAWIPALALSLLVIASIYRNVDWGDLIAPIALVALGLVLLVRALLAPTENPATPPPPDPHGPPPIPPVPGT